MTQAVATRIPLATERGDALSMREKLSYGSGEVASNLAWNMATGFLLLYYTDVAMLPVAALGTLMLVTRVLDAVFDPLVGVAVDRTRSRFGRARPYLAYASIPFVLLFVATFSVPDLSAGAKVVYAYVTFGLLGLAYSLLYVPYSSMLPMLTRARAEKVQLGSFRAMGSSIASVAAYGVVIPLVTVLGRGDRQLGFTLTAAILATATIALYLTVFFNCKERHTTPIRQDASVWNSAAKMFRNPAWRVLFALSFAIFVRIGVMVSSFAFFAKDVLGQLWVVSVALPVSSIVIFSGGLFASRLFLRVSKRRACILAHLLSAPLFLAMYLSEGTPILFIAFFLLASFAGGIQAATFYIMGAEVVERQEKQFGQRDEGLIAASVSFGVKVGLAIGAAVTAYALALSHYDPHHATASANTTLRVLTYFAPVVLSGVGIYCMYLYRFEERGPADHV